MDLIDNFFVQSFQPKLHMTESDFETFTHNGSLCDDEGGLGLQNFEDLMRNEVCVLQFPTCVFSQCKVLRMYQNMHVIDNLSMRV